MDPKEQKTAAPEKSTPPAESTSDSAARPKAKRKFRFRIGTLEFEKRCTAAEAVTAARDSGALIALEIDGYSFSLQL